MERVRKHRTDILDAVAVEFFARSVSAMWILSESSMRCERKDTTAGVFEQNVDPTKAGRTKESTAANRQYLRKVVAL